MAHFIFCPEFCMFFVPKIALERMFGYRRMGYCCCLAKLLCFPYKSNHDRTYTERSHFLFFVAAAENVPFPQNFNKYIRNLHNYMRRILFIFFWFSQWLKDMLLISSYFLCDFDVSFRNDFLSPKYVDKNCTQTAKNNA